MLVNSGDFASENNELSLVCSAFQRAFEDGDGGAGGNSPDNSISKVLSSLLAAHFDLQISARADS